MMVFVDEMQFGFIPETGTIVAVFISRRMLEDYHAKGKKLYMCFVDLEKAFGRVQRKVLEWTVGKKEIQKVLATSVMSLYEGAKTRVGVDSEFEVKVWMHQGSVLSPFLFAVMVDVVTDACGEWCAK